MSPNKSLDQLEKEYWNPAPSALESEACIISLESDFNYSHCKPVYKQSLCGEWEMVCDGYTVDRTDNGKNWGNSVVANIPCTVHTALFEAGVIPDPMFAKNDKYARENSYKTWWLRKRFKLDQALQNPQLVFDGVCYRAKVWLNGTYLGEHGGMFGGPEYDVSTLLKPENLLLVKIENSPADPKSYSEYGDLDEGWKYGCVINCVYGWHYACIPTRGIWAPVNLVSKPRVSVKKPFIATIDAQEGIIDLCINAEGENCKGTVGVSIRPKNFDGKTYGFNYNFDNENQHYRIKIDNPQLWWPVGHGKQNLYSMEISFCPDDDIPQYFCETFGIRTIEMAPLPGGPYEDKHNWTFVINKKPIFVKGTNWCTTDALLRCTNEKYDRFLTLAKRQNIQLLRAWGGGIPETDYFYNKCDELGIMVMQEWPTCWDSQKTQPKQELLETVRYGVIRLRNHPSLVQWAGGNESAKADGEAMDEMARLCYELDGSRCFHRTSPWGGAIHNYDTYWNKHDIDVTLRLKSPFMGEFGMASAPNINSVNRYLPENEKGVWPVPEKGSFNYHTPRFNEYTEQIDREHLDLRAPEFNKLDTMENWIVATQLAQSTCIRHTLEAYRTRWPESTAICYYKLTDVFPACSWSTVDYYGVQKLSYYVIQDSYSPYHACVVFDSTTATEDVSLPVYLLDDALIRKSDAKVKITAFNEDFKIVKASEYYPIISNDTVCNLGDFHLNKSQTNSCPLFITSEIIENGKTVDSTYYWLNYKKKSGCLFDRPETTLNYKVIDSTHIEIINTGNNPAIGVTIECLTHDTEFVTEDSVFWLNPQESKTVEINFTNDLTIKSWNCSSAKLV